ncbi:MAG: M28 family peptidase [Proteobacteria bacterium]|nr:M28 family peptidase [Pseudomonadota bacterium]MDA0994746.1 M28 family peptidase [Pseudomonadota bacterium]
MRFLAFAILIASSVLFAADDNIVGFNKSSSDNQRALETQMDASINAEEMTEWLRRMSAEPHHVGSLASKEVAEFIAELFESWGYETEIVSYEILLPVPKTREIELVAPTNFVASLREETLAEDPSTAVRETLLQPYNAFSIDGEVEAELVFVNYGMPEDYEILERYGIDVTGKIAIAKYGRSWRGIKPKLAGEKGAIGTIIYSDPADDGYAAGDVYPKGPFKNDSGVQRGSVMDMPTYPGDVLTPGRGATERTRRLKKEDASTITKIPVLPISYRDALPLLSAMGGEVVPQEWRGALPITYHLGPGPAKVRLKAEFDWNMVTAYNVIARLTGSDYPDEWVIRGNHHDGWNHGASDPLSGQVAMLAEAKAVAELAKAGHPPLRTIIYGAWDAEEPGLIGSTEWAEDHADELKAHAVAYLNTDGSARGFLGIGGSHVLERYLNQIAEDVKDPRADISLKERSRAYQVVNGDAKEREEAKDRRDLRISPLGSGSDYTPFLQHLGIASVNLGFGGEASDGSYHTLYDTYEHFTKFKDPGLIYGATLAKVTGRATLRLANAPRLPFEFKGLADNVALYVKEIEELADGMREKTGMENRLIQDGTYAIAMNPYKTFGPPIAKAPVPHFNFAPLKNALGRLQESADAFDEAAANNDETSAAVNKLLYTSERLLTRDAGLDGRPWYKHHIYAPGFYTGYGVKTIPGVREAIEQREYDKVGTQIDIAADVLNDMADRINSLAEML